MAHCLACGNPLVRDAALSLGPLPPCNRFGEADPERFPLSAGQCGECGLVQLLDLPPPAWIRPRHAWIRYNEPSGHLADLAAKLREEMAGAVRVVGVGPFEDPLHTALDWASERRVLPLRGDGYLEAWQAMLATPGAEPAVSAELVTCRYLLEHSHDPKAALRGLASLLAPGGKLYIEVPDSSKFLDAGDISFLWEEHTCYFTEASLRRLAAEAGMRVRVLWRYPGQLEDALCLLLEAGESEVLAPPASEFARFAAYREACLRQHDAYTAALTEQARTVIFGAGHQAIMFIHALGLTELIDAVIDDAPDKAWSTIPGTAIPILPSRVLQDDADLSLCLLAIGPAVVAKLEHVFAPLRARGVRLHSLFPGAGSGTLIDP